MNERELELIHNYIDSKVRKDTDFATKINLVRVKLNDPKREQEELTNYIMSQAKNYLHRRDGMVEDSTVFNWVYDFYHDFDLDNVAPPKAKEAPKEEKKKVEQEVKTEEKVAQPALKKLKKDLNDELGQISLFD